METYGWTQNIQGAKIKRSKERVEKNRETERGREANGGEIQRNSGKDKEKSRNRQNIREKEDKKTEKQGQN